MSPGVILSEVRYRCTYPRCRSQDSGSYDTSSKGNPPHDQGPPGLDPGGDIQVTVIKATKVMK